MKIGYSDDWENRSKKHVRDGWEIVAVMRDTRQAETRFKQQLREEGFKPVAGRGADEIFYLTHEWLNCARRCCWPLGSYKKPFPLRASKFSKPANDSSQKDLFNGAA